MILFDWLIDWSINWEIKYVVDRLIERRSLGWLFSSLSVLIVKQMMIYTLINWSITRLLVVICLIDRKCLIPPSLVPWSFSELTDCSAIKWIYWVFDQDINPSLNSDEIIQPELIDSVTDTLIACTYMYKGVWCCLLVNPWLQITQMCDTRISLILYPACHLSLSSLYI